MHMYVPVFQAYVFLNSILCNCHHFMLCYVFFAMWELLLSVVVLSKRLPTSQESVVQQDCVSSGQFVFWKHTSWDPVGLVWLLSRAYSLNYANQSAGIFLTTSSSKFPSTYSAAWTAWLLCMGRSFLSISPSALTMSSTDFLAAIRLPPCRIRSFWTTLNCCYCWISLWWLARA